jgi:hypothetical protein
MSGYQQIGRGKIELLAECWRWSRGGTEVGLPKLDHPTGIGCARTGDRHDGEVEVAGHLGDEIGRETGNGTVRS